MNDLKNFLTFSIQRKIFSRFRHIVFISAICLIHLPALDGCVQKKSKGGDRNYSQTENSNGVAAKTEVDSETARSQPVQPYKPLLAPVDPQTIAADKRTSASLLTITDSAAYQYYLFIPENYKALAEGQYVFPLLVYLHGGEDNPDENINTIVFKWGPLKGIDKVFKNGTIDPAFVARLGNYFRTAIIVYPYLPNSNSSDTFWDPYKLDTLVEKVMDEYRVDRRRFYMTGVCLGGAGTFHYATSFSQKIAAIVPTASISYGGEIMKGLADISIWTTHNFSDSTANIHKTTADVLNNIFSPKIDVMGKYPYRGNNKSQDAGDIYTLSIDNSGLLGNWERGFVYPKKIITFTVFNKGSHDSWSATYSNPDIWKWMFSQIRPSDAKAE
ncbi:MAG: hypothetical protein HQK54_05165 [Oligoflexales bacterium]|nr:hypothetical protein [Oligoflexales bacterium]